MGSKGSWSCMTGFVVGRFYSLKYGLLDGFLTYDGYISAEFLFKPRRTERLRICQGFLIVEGYKSLQIFCALKLP